MKIRIECTDSQNISKNISTDIDSSLIQSMYKMHGTNTVIETIPMIVAELDVQIHAEYDAATDTWKK